MDYEFKSLEELYKRVRPALHAKEEEFHRLGYPYVNELDIWNYLIEKKWRKGKDLMLSDIVSDIMNTDCKELAIYLKIKDSESKRTQDFDDKNEG